MRKIVIFMLGFILGLMGIYALSKTHSHLEEIEDI